MVSEWWSDDPSNGGHRIGPAPKVSATYETEVVVSPSPQVPNNPLLIQTDYDRQQMQIAGWRKNYLIDNATPLSFLFHEGSLYFGQALFRLTLSFAPYVFWLPFAIMGWRKFRLRCPTNVSRSLLYALLFAPALGDLPYFGLTVLPILFALFTLPMGLLSASAAGCLVWLFGLWPLEKYPLPKKLLIGSAIALPAGLFAGDFLFGGAKKIVEDNIAGMDFYRLLTILQTAAFGMAIVLVIAFQSIAMSQTHSLSGNRPRLP